MIARGVFFFLWGGGGNRVVIVLSGVGLFFRFKYALGSCNFFFLISWGLRGGLTNGKKFVSLCFSKGKEQNLQIDEIWQISSRCILQSFMRDMELLRRVLEELYVYRESIKHQRLK